MGKDAGSGRGRGRGRPREYRWRLGGDGSGAGLTDSEARDRGDLTKVGPQSQSGKAPGRDGDTWPVGRDWYIRVSRETGDLGRRSRASLRWAEGRAQVLLGFMVRMQRED